MPEGPGKGAAVDHLHRGQSNDCYWHGLFGGIYISHMRLATYEHLIAAEDAADRALGTMTTAAMQDLDLDGLAEVLLADEGQVVAVKPGDGGGIGGWDVRAARHALAAALRRRPEAYHETLRAHDAAVASARGRAGAGGGTATGDKPMSIHDIVMVKEEGLAARLFYDDHERRSGLVRFLPERHDARGVRAGGARPSSATSRRRLRRRPPGAGTGLAVPRGRRSPASGSR